VLLLAGAVAALFVAVRLAAAAAGSGFSPAETIPGLDDGGLTAALALLGVAAVIVLLSLLLRDDEPRLCLENADPRDDLALSGAVLVSAGALEGAVEAAAFDHPEVLRVRAAARGDARLLRLDVRVAARPLADASRVGDDVRRRAEAAVRPLVAGVPVEVKARTKVLSVRRLARYLP
jgi:hypothetical protein